MLSTAGYARAATTTTCSIATGSAAHVLCWLDLTGYAGTGTSAYAWTLPDGSTLSGSLQNASTTSTGTPTGLPTWTRAELGQNAYTGVLGKPAMYGSVTNDKIPLKIAALALADPGGAAVSPFLIIGADAESTDSGDGTGTGYIDWTTSGQAWTELQQIVVTGNQCALTIGGLVGALNAQCLAGATAAPSDPYLLQTVVATGQSVSMSLNTSTALNGYAFAIRLATLSVSKTLKGRSLASDQFTVRTRYGTHVSFSATTSGTATTATTGAGGVLPGKAYTLDELAASGALTQYVTTYACTNATTGSATTLPSGTGTSFNVTPATDDQIACTFTNVPLTLTVVPKVATATVAPATTQTDSFTLTNTGTLAGTIAVAAPLITSSTGTAVTPSAYGFNGKSYTTLAALNSAIAAAGTTAAAGSIVVTVTYTTSAGAATNDTVQLPATIATGSSTSAVASGTETDTITANVGLTIGKTGTTATSPGGLIAYSILVGNSGPSDANGTTLSDPLPAGLAVSGTPVCGNATGGASCGSVTATGGTIASTIAALPVGSTLTFTFDATAAAAGSYVNTATVTPPSGDTGGAKSSSLTTSVAQSNGLQKTVLNVTSNPNGTPVTSNSAVPGDLLLYTLTFTNTTGATLTNPVFTDAIPAHTTFVKSACPAANTTLPASITCSTSPASPATGTNLVFTFTGTLAAGASISASLEVKVI